MDELSEGEDNAVKSAFRVLKILELLTAAFRPLSFLELQQQLGYPKASLHGLLRTMMGSRWLRFVEDSKGYTLGVKIWEAGLAYSGMQPLEVPAKLFMTRLRDQTTKTVQLAVLDDYDVLYVGKVDGEHMLRLDSAVGRRLEPHASGVGRILLADLAESELRAWMAERPLRRFTATTITDPEALLVELQTVKAAGYATDREERTLGAACVPVGIRDHADALVAAMSVSAPAVRFGLRQHQAAFIHLRQAASDLSAALGRGTVPSHGSAPNGSRRQHHDRTGPRAQGAHANHVGRTP